MALEVKPLKYKSITGLSERQLAEHHDVLYAGYVNKYNEICTQLSNIDTSAANATYSEIRELQHEKGFALNGIKLHEYYFDNLTDQTSEISGPIKKLIETRWGSVESWAEEFAALGVAARGWVVLSWDFDLNALDNIICDAHNQGAIWNGTTILVMDVYEHAYFLDYGVKRKDYIAAFMAAIDWNIVNERLPKWVVEKYNK